MSAARHPVDAAPELVRDRAARFARSVAACPEATPADLLVLIEEALLDRELFPLVWPHIVTVLRREPHLNRARLATALSRMWTASGDMEPAGLRGLAHAAYACFDMRTAQRALDQLAGLHELSITDLLLKSMCRAAVGDLRAAIELCDTVLSREPYNLNATSVRRRLKNRVDSWSPPWRVPVSGDGMLLLEPLDVDHAAPLAWQYRDPAIAEKTVLPSIDHPGHAPQWIEHRLAESPAVYALIHREHGFVGSAEIAVSGAEAFLCLWIGADWQGRGFGRGLIDMACRHAFKAGIEVMLTAAFDDNVASLRALRGCGFVELPVRALEPDHERTFLYYAPTPMDHDDVVRRLIGFCARTNTGLAFPDASANQLVAATEASSQSANPQ